jgi:hypothetical protein
MDVVKFHSIYIDSSLNGYIATKEYFLFNGHDLEAKIKDTWKPLNKQAQGGDNVLKNHVLDTVWTDYPEFISTDFIDLFVKIV